MANVQDVANYILQKKGGMTTLKLQKLVYFCQAYSLAWDGIPLFDDDFEAWANGPVCPALFATHRGKFEVQPNEYEDNITDFPVEAKETMDIVLDAYGDKSANWLKDLTHEQYPWKQARKGYAPGEICTVTIDKDIMQEFYGKEE